MKETIDGEVTKCETHICNGDLCTQMKTTEADNCHTDEDGFLQFDLKDYLFLSYVNKGQLQRCLRFFGYN